MASLPNYGIWDDTLFWDDSGAWHDHLSVWSFITQGNQNESIEFATDVLKSFGGEQRISLRTKPRQKISYNYTLTAQQYSRIKNYIRFNGSGLWCLPIWHEATRGVSGSASDTEVLFDTAYADYRDEGYALIWQDDNTYEVVWISTVVADRLNLGTPVQNDYSDAYILPLRIASMPNLSVGGNRDKGEYVDVTASFFIIDTYDLSADATDYTTYNGYQVLEDRPIKLGSFEESIVWPQTIFDNKTGRLYTDTERDQSFFSTLVTWNTGICGQSRANLWSIRTWLHRMRGRALSFYMPSWNNDLNASGSIGPTDTSIDVDNIGFSIYYGSSADIMILLRDGTRYYRSVTSIIPGASVETVNINAPLGVSVSVNDIEMISILTLSRLDSDRIEVAHTNGGATISVPVIEVPV